MADLAPRPIALVTGASSGIGRAFAEKLACEGHDLVLVARRRARLEDLAGQLAGQGARCEILVADLSVAGDLAAVEQRAAAGDLAFLVNNAGFQTYVPFVELDPDRADEQIQVQVTAVVRLSRAALPAMLVRGAGTIINVASMLGFSAGMTQPFLPKRAVYAATKAFVNAFTELLAVELEGAGVRVQSLCPGVVRTEFHDVDGEPKLRPDVPVMDPAELVAASLAALSLGEVICAPALGDATLIAAERAARHAVFGGGLGAQPAPRYGVGSAR